MMTGQLFINRIDAWTQWGVFLEDGSYDKLLLPPPMKPYVENKSRTMDGKQVIVKPPMFDERDITLIFCFANRYNFQQRLNDFLAVIMGINQYYTGLPTELGIGELDKKFKLNYISSLELSSMDNKMGKLAIRFNEPVPNIPTTTEI